MKFIAVSFVLVIHLALITSVAIIKPPHHEKPKQDKTHNGNVIFLAQAVQELQAMQLANDKHSKNNIKLAEKLLNEKVKSETTENYQLDTTIIVQHERELVKNGHIAAKGEVILNQLNDESLVIIPSDTKDVVTDQKSDAESKTMAEISKSAGVRNHVTVKDAHELHKSHDINHEGIAPGAKRENKSKLDVKSKLPQHPSQQAPSSDSKESKRNHIVQNRKASDHTMADKSKTAPSIDHHKTESVMPYNKAATDMHVAGESDFEMTNRNKLTNADIHVHGNLTAASKTTSSKVNDQQNSPKSNSDQQHKKLIPSISAHNSVNHSKKSKIEKKHHEIISKKGSQPKLNVIDTSQEDSLDPSKDDTDLVDPSKEDTDLIDPSKEDADLVDPSKADADLVDPSKEDADLVDPSKEDTVMVDHSKEDTDLVDPSKEDTVMVDPSNEYTDLEDPSVDNSELLYHLKEDSELIASSKNNVNLKDSSQEEAILKNPLTEGSESLIPSTGDIKLQMPPDSPSLKVDSDSDENEVSVKVANNNLVKVSSPEKKGTEESNKKVDNADLKPIQNHSKHLQRKPFVKKPVQKYHPVKLTHKPKDAKPKNLDNNDIYPETKVANAKSSEPEAHDTSLQKPESVAPDSKLPMKSNPLMQKIELKNTLPDDPKVKKNEVAAHKEEADSKNQDSKDVLTYVKHESQMSYRKKSASSNYIIAVTLILIVSIILFTIVGVYYRQIRIDRRKYIGHMLLETEDDEDMQLFNRQTYHDDANHGYESWNAIR